MREFGRTLTPTDLLKLTTLIGDHGLDIAHVASILTTEEVEHDEMYQIFQEFDKNGMSIFLCLPYVTT